MLNNKGFAVSSVLYTLLIAFLLFLGAALAQFSASSSLIGKANDDLVNGSSFEAMQIKPNGDCKDGNEWYQDSDGKTSNTIVRIKTRYGIKYWPKDFKKEDDGSQAGFLKDNGTIATGDYISKDNGKIKTTVTSKEEVRENVSETVRETVEKSIFYLKITDALTDKQATYPISNNIEGFGMGIFDICNSQE